MSSKPKDNRIQAVIVDIDGTVARHWNRTPFEWDKVGDDRPIKPICDLVKLLAGAVNIVFVSGRSDICKPQTIEWLDKHVTYPRYLYMRHDGDFRKDSEVKNEIYQSIKENFDVWFVLDDRNQTVKEWRDMGLTCLQVAEGDF